MRRLVLSAALLAAFAAGCTEQAPAPTDALNVEVHFSKADPKNFHTHLTGAEENPPKETQAQGQLKAQLSADGQALHYKLIVSNIENVVATHFHLGAPGANGPPVAFLAGPYPAGGGRVNGVLAEGAITTASLIGPMAGQTLSDLLEAMQAGNIYVNVHTNDGVAPVNSGPGDFPGGEVRGQVQGGG